ncbi:MAG: DNA-directed RNA polymerase subunit P [Methanopyri archaeon]|nr:DNA-directed RNA polymerase subunit P [Methanopyri archaeon]
MEDEERYEYRCMRCGAKVMLDINSDPIRCTNCGFRIVVKPRKPVPRRYKAR